MTTVRYFPTTRFPKVRFFDASNPSPEQAVDWQPRADVLERDNAYEVVLDLPGVNRESVNVSFENDVLKVEGEVARDEEKAHYYRRERHTGTFSRSFRVPEHGVNADGISAKFDNGLLTISLPKAAEVLPKKIEIAG